MTQPEPLAWHTTPLTGADFANWEPLRQGYVALYRAAVPQTTTALTVERLTGTTEPMGGSPVRDGGAGAGAVAGMVNGIDHRSCWTPGDDCCLQDLFVTPRARGTGAGRAPIAAVITAARDRGRARVYWLTHETDREAMALDHRIAERSRSLQYRQML